MSDRQKFKSKMKRLAKQQRRAGYYRTQSVNHDGMVLGRAPARGGFPWHLVPLAAAAFWLFKAFAYTTNGPTAYLEHVEGLQLSGGLGGFAVWMMQADSLTIWIAQYLQAFV